MLSAWVLGPPFGCEILRRSLEWVFGHLRRLNMESSPWSQGEIIRNRPIGAGESGIPRQPSVRDSKGAIRVSLHSIFSCCGLLGLLCHGGSVRAQEMVTPSLVLEEIRAIDIPRGFELRGAVVTRTQSVLFWSEQSATVVFEQPLIRPDQPQIVRMLCPQLLERPIAAAFVAGDSIIEIIEASKKQILRTGPEASCRSVGSIDLNGEMISAVRTEAGWVIGSQTPEEAPRISGISSQGGIRWEIVSDGTVGNPTNVPTASLSRGKDGALLTSIRWPFSWAASDDLGKLGVQRGPVALSPEAPSDPLPELSDWGSLPVLPLDNGYLQVLADPASDRRLLILYGPSGRVLRFTEVDVPMGLISSLPEESLLVGLRSTDVIQIVVYRWRWQTLPNSKKEES